MKRYSYHLKKWWWKSTCNSQKSHIRKNDEIKAITGTVQTVKQLGPKWWLGGHECPAKFQSKKSICAYIDGSCAVVV